MLPQIKLFEDIEIDGPVCLIGAVGFEDRSIAIFEELSDSQTTAIDSAIGIKYKPFKPNNKARQFKQGLEKIGVGDDCYQDLIYDRYDPEAFEQSFNDLLEEISIGDVLLDISGMSKFLIMITIHHLAENDINLTIFYAEADTYYPIESKFEERKCQTDDPDETPAFLTEGIYDIVISRSLSSTAKSNQPMVAIVFPTFNYRDMMAMANEISPHQIVSIIGTPRLEKNKWRKDAIPWINRNVYSYLEVREEYASTFEYIDTIRLLEKLYAEYATHNRILLAPTGSKLQTVASSIFRRSHSDIQVVYPAVKDYKDEYSEGWREPWGISFGDIDKVANEITKNRTSRIDRLKERASEINELWAEGQLN